MGAIVCDEADRGKALGEERSAGEEELGIFHFPFSIFHSPFSICHLSFCRIFYLRFSICDFLLRSAPLLMVLSRRTLTTRHRERRK